jgi:hypothetical protein
MSTQSQISATISSATKEELDRFTESHGFEMIGSSAESVGEVRRG